MLYKNINNHYQKESSKSIFEKAYLIMKGIFKVDKFAETRNHGIELFSEVASTSGIAFI